MIPRWCLCGASCGTSSQFLGDWRRLLVRSQVKLDFLIKLVKVFVDQMTLTLNSAAVGSGCWGLSHDALSTSACLWLLYYFCHSWFVLASSFSLLFSVSSSHLIFFFLHFKIFVFFYVRAHNSIFLFLKTLIINVNLVLSSQQHKNDTKIQHSEDWLLRERQSAISQESAAAAGAF